jgi:hypothetical protein
MEGPKEAKHQGEHSFERHFFHGGVVFTRWF